MSQSSFLDDVMLWNKEECHRQCQVALPRLIDFAEKDCTLDLIQMILQNFSTVCQPVDLENIIFRKLAKKISCRYDNLFEEIISIIDQQQLELQEIQRGILSLLEAAVSVVEGLELCIREVLLTCTTLEICHVHSLLPTVIHVIHGSYDHCKESSSVYRDQLTIVSDQLSVLFKKVHSLQMTFLNLLDKLVLTASSSECDMEDVAEAILGLHSIGEVATHLDIKITVTVWKAISKLACLHKAFLQDKIDYSPMLIALCTNMTSAFDYLVQSLPLQSQETSGELKAFMKNIKILGFQMKILLKFVNEFGSELSKDCIKKVYQLMIHIQRLSPPSLESVRVPKVYVEEIQKQLTNGVEPLVKKQIANKSFIQCITATRQDLDHSALSWCLMLLTVAEYLLTQPVEIQKIWLSPDCCSQEVARCSIVEAVFCAVKECYVELSVPVTINTSFCSGKPHREVSLYEYICTKLCALVASCPAQCFHTVEKCLLQQVLQPATHNALLAVDVWCFLARYGSADLCHDHCVFLTNLLLQDGLNATPQCCHLLILLRRLLKFLAPQHHEGYVKQFHISDHTLPLWSVFPLHVLNGELCTQVVGDIIQYTSQCTHSYLQCPGNRTAAQTLKVDTCLRCMHNVLANPFIRERNVKASQCTEMTHISVKLLQLLQTDDMYIYTPLQKCGADLLYLVSSLELENVHVHMVLEFIHGILKHCKQNRSCSCDDLTISSLHFLQSLGKKRFPPASKQSEILHLLPRLFTCLLSDSNPIIRTQSLRVFSQFAEETAHETVVTDSLSNDRDVQQRVVTYLNKLSSKKTVKAPDVDILREEHLKLQEFREADLTSLYKPVTWPAKDTTEPLSKRIKLDENILDEAELVSAIQGLKENTSRIRQALDKNPKNIPEWLQAELRHCQSLLNNLL